MDTTVKIKVEGGIYVGAELELPLEDLTIGGTLQDDVIVLPLPECALRIEGAEVGTARLVICADGFEQDLQAAALADGPEDDTAKQLHVGESKPLIGPHVLQHASGVMISIFAPDGDRASFTGASQPVNEAPVVASSAARSTGIPTGVPIGIWGLGIVSILSLWVIGMVLFRSAYDAPQITQALPVDTAAAYRAEAEATFEVGQNPQQARVSSEPDRAGFAVPAKVAQLAMLLPAALETNNGSTPLSRAKPVSIPAGPPEAPTKIRENDRIPVALVPNASQQKPSADHASEAPQEKAIRFLAKRLEEHNLSGIKLISEQHALRAQGSHLASSRTVWHDIQSEYDVVWSQKVPLVVATKEVAPKIPFRVRSVWLGNEPQLITVRGDRFKIGDQTSDKWQIRKISAEDVLLERNGIIISVAVR